MMTLGKGLGGGVPIGALLALEFACCFEPGDQGGTYCGNALMCAVALAVLDAGAALGFLAATQARGAQLRGGLNAIAARIGSPPVSGRGLLLALELPASHPAAALADGLLARAGVVGQRAGLLIVLVLAVDKRENAAVYSAAIKRLRGVGRAEPTPPSSPARPVRKASPSGSPPPKSAPPPKAMARRKKA